MKGNEIAAESGMLIPPSFILLGDIFTIIDNRRFYET